jgi:hypothetical protein
VPIGMREAEDAAARAFAAVFNLEPVETPIASLSFDLAVA